MDRWGGESRRVLGIRLIEGRGKQESSRDKTDRGEGKAGEY